MEDASAPMHSNDSSHDMSQQRVDNLKLDLGTLGIQILPLCILSKVSLSCGALSHFKSGTLLMNEFQAAKLNISLGL